MARRHPEPESHEPALLAVRAESRGAAASTAIGRHITSEPFVADQIDSTITVVSAPTPAAALTPRTVVPFGAASLPFRVVRIDPRDRSRADWERWGVTRSVGHAAPRPGEDWVLFYVRNGGEEDFLRDLSIAIVRRDPGEFAQVVLEHRHRVDEWDALANAISAVLGDRELAALLLEAVAERGFAQGVRS